MTNLDKAFELRKSGNFAMRSCWECNPSHEHLKKIGGLFTCIDCGRYYMNGGYLSNDNHSKKEYKEKRLKNQ